MIYCRAAGYRAGGGRGLLRRHRIGSLPVVKDRQLVGIITRSDILDFVLSGGRAPALRKRKIPQIKKPPAKPAPRASGK